MTKQSLTRTLLSVLAILAAMAWAPRLVCAASARPETKLPWQVEWEKTLAAAKKEGKVLVYGHQECRTLRSPVLPCRSTPRALAPGDGYAVSLTAG